MSVQSINCKAGIGGWQLRNFTLEVVPLETAAEVTKSVLKENGKDGDVNQQLADKNRFLF